MDLALGTQSFLVNLSEAKEAIQVCCGAFWRGTSVNVSAVKRGLPNENERPGKSSTQVASQLGQHMERKTRIYRETIKSRIEKYHVYCGSDEYQEGLPREKKAKIQDKMQFPLLH